MMAKENPKKLSSSFDYTAAYVLIDSFQKEQLPLSEKKVLSATNLAAFSEKNVGFYIKSLVRLRQIEIDISDDNSDSFSFYKLIKEIEKCKNFESALPFLQLMMAQECADKLNNYQRNSQIDDDNDLDWNNWSKQKLNLKIIEACSVALSFISHHSSKNLLLTDATIILPILSDTTIANIGDYTVEQLVIIEIISILKQAALEASFLYVEPDTKLVLAPLNEFVNHKFENITDPKNQFLILKMFQELLGCIGTKNNNLLVTIDFNRLQYARTINLGITDQIWLSALESAYLRYKQFEYSNLFAQAIASELLDKNPLKAREIIIKALEMYPDFGNNNQLRILKLQIETAFFTTEIERNNAPEKPILAKITYQNMVNLNVKVWKISFIDYDLCKQNNPNYYDHPKCIDSAAKIVANYSLNLMPFSDYQQHSIEIGLRPLPKGQYIFEFSKVNIDTVKDGKASFSDIINITDLAWVISINQLNKANTFQIYNAKTGNFAKNIACTLFEQTLINGKYAAKKIANFKTDKEGTAILPLNVLSKRYVSFYVLIDKENIALNNFYDARNFSLPNQEKQNTEITIFTDRNIYRPGQLIYFKSIVYNNELKEVMPNQLIEVLLKDHNGQLVDTINLSSNEFGSINGNFSLPKNGKNMGAFHISFYWNGKMLATKNIQVEEYKRSKFEATILEPIVNYKLNDAVRLIGNVKAFAGYGIANANVKYTVTRSKNSLYKRYFGEEAMLLKTAIVVSDNKGVFYIDFDAKTDNDNELDNINYNFAINAVITDINGETVECNYTLFLAKTDLIIGITATENQYLNQPIKCSIFAQNLQGVKQPFNGVLTIEKILPKSKIYRERLWEKPDTQLYDKSTFEKLFPDYSYQNVVETREVFKDILNDYTEVEYYLPMISKPGKYKINIFSKDKLGIGHTTFQQINVLPSKTGKYDLENTLSIGIINNKDYKIGDIAEIVISSGDEVAVDVKIESYRGIIYSKRIKLCKSSQLIKIPIIEKDQGGISISAKTVKNYRSFDQNTALSVPYFTKQFGYKWSTFRDKTLPGAKEKWIITLTEPERDKIIAEHLASMYDLALDKLWSANEFNFFPYNNYYGQWTNMAEFNSTSNYFYEDYTSIAGDDNINLPSLHLIDRYRHNNYYRSFAADSMRYKNANIISSLNQSPNNEVKNDFLVSDSESIVENINPLLIRQNFNETAFFFPDLLTNKKGELVLEFTIPESITTWKFLLLGHTKDLHIGKMTSQITATKSFMIQPDIPRFFREGDKIAIATKVVNLDTLDCTAMVYLNITDAITKEKLNWAGNNAAQSILVMANNSSMVVFEILIPDFTGPIDIEIIADNGSVKDGELHQIPVLSNRKLITTSLPITVTEKGTQNLIFKALKNAKSGTMKTVNFSAEMCSNPSWYAVQSLGFLKNNDEKSADQVFNKLYANAIVNHILMNTSGIKKMVENWHKNGDKDSQILLSKLALNENVKSTLLSETPWVNESISEQERIKNLILLFDESKNKEALKSTFELLKSMQSYNGGWAWYADMDANVYITQSIIIGFGKLTYLGIDISAYQSVISAAISFLDLAAESEYNEAIKKTKKNVFISPISIQYLYCKAYFLNLGFNKNHAVVKYFLQEAAANWQTQSLKNQAQTAMALYTIDSSNNVTVAIIKSLKERAIYNPTLGMYWKNNIGGYYWYDAPISTQAAIIEAFVANNQDGKLIAQQQIWLLRQKQTQHWETNAATADACFALLMHGSLLDNTMQVSIENDVGKINTADGLARSGYVSAVLAIDNITAKSAEIKVNANGNGFAYGAIYWQYLENLEKIPSNNSGLGIEKKLYKEIYTIEGVKKQLLSSNDTVNVGDIIDVRLTIYCDRNMEFVHIKALRGSGTEPIDVISGFQYLNNIAYYKSTLDASSNFFIENLAKGNYQINYKLKVQQTGKYNAGLATIQCFYAPEFVGNSQNIVLNVKLSKN